jgi:hypothetical protein
MNKKYISPMIFGFVAGVLMVVPVIKSLGCCLLLPLAAFFSLMLEQKANNNYEKLDIKKGLIFGLITGLVAAFFGTFFDFLITLITHKNDFVITFPKLVETINSFPVDDLTKEEVIKILSGIVENITSSGFSSVYIISLFINNLIMNTIFGILGGIIGVQILNSRNKNLE